MGQQLEKTGQSTHLIKKITGGAIEGGGLFDLRGQASWVKTEAMADMMADLVSARVQKGR